MNRAVNLCFALAVLSGCGAVPARSGSDVQKAINPVTPPQRNVTDFSDALGCMDDLLLRFGVVDTTVLLEELQDKTQKLNAGTRDMLVSAVSDMTRRSRAIRLVTFGSDTNNAVNLQGQLEKRQPFRRHVAQIFGPVLDDGQLERLTDLRRGQAYAGRLAHRFAHLVDELADGLAADLLRRKLARPVACHE